MPSPAEIPHADEALKSLVAQFKQSPRSGVFVELASALLVRGHASEALRIAEHGLQVLPDSAHGRVERAAALLALGRPRVAYVELRRALAIDNNHRKALRLLGKAYKEAGAPERAAQLLTTRFSGAHQTELSTVSAIPSPAIPAAAKTEPQGRAAPIPSEPSSPKKPKKPATWPASQDIESTSPTLENTNIPELFSDLTKDLGLGSIVPEAPQKRVEVTQIIRRRAMPRPPRSASELVAIEGPIVDTTQPGQIVETQDAPPPLPSSIEPAPLFSGPGGEATLPPALALDDEPLFQENMPFSVRPVADTSDLSLEPEPLATTQLTPPRGNDTSDTVVDQVEESSTPLQQISTIPTPVDLIGDLDQLQDEPPMANGALPGEDAEAATLPPKRPAELSKSISQAKDTSPALKTPPRAAPTVPMASPKPEARAPTIPAGPDLKDTLEPDAVAKDERGGLGVPIIERTRQQKGARLTIVSAKARRTHLILAGLGAMGMVLYLTVLMLLSEEQMKVWMGPAESAAPKEQASK